MRAGSRSCAALSDFCYFCMWDVIFQNRMLEAPSKLALVDWLSEVDSTFPTITRALTESVVCILKCLTCTPGSHSVCASCNLLNSLIPTWGKSSKHSDRENPLSMGSLLMERIFQLTPNQVLTAHTLVAARCVTEAIQCHLCRTYRGLWGLVVVRLSYFRGRALAAQAKCPGFDFRRLPAFSLSSIFAS